MQETNNESFELVNDGVLTEQESIYLENEATKKVDVAFDKVNDFVTNAESLVGEVESLIDDIADDGEFNNSVSSSIENDLVETVEEFTEETEDIVSVSEPIIAVETIEEFKAEQEDEKASDSTEQVTDKIISGDDLREQISVVKQCFNNVENVLLSLYNGVFSKNPNFNISYSQVVNDLISYLGVKCAKLGVFAKFTVEFNASESVLNAQVSDGNYVPLIIKLTAMIDKQAKSSCTKAVVNELTKILFEFLKGNDLATTLIANELSAIYTYVLTIGLNLI